MKIKDIPENQKLWGIKFLIEDFYYNNKEFDKNRAVAIDKMQTFWMIYSQSIEKDRSSEGKKLTAIFLNSIRNVRDYAPIHELKKKPSFEELDVWFTSEITTGRFKKIYNNDHFDYKKPEDLILAFNLADGILERSETREYAVLESLYLKKKGIDRLKNERVKEYQERFAEEIKTIEISDQIHAKQLIKDYSELEIKKEYKNITHLDVVNYFIFQKMNNYPLLNELYKIWVVDIRKIVGEIIKTIIQFIKNSRKETLINKYCR